jgi:hypothetical protein
MRTKVRKIRAVIKSWRLLRVRMTGRSVKMRRRSINLSVWLRWHRKALGTGVSYLTNLCQLV